MTFNHRKWGTIALLLATGCGSSDGPVAGGQSGTDANGGYQCSWRYEQPEGEPVELDEPIKTGLSPNDYYARVEGELVFACQDGEASADDVKYTVSITRRDAARRVLGRLNDSAPDELCEGLQLDAEIRVEAEDGSLSHEASFLTANLLGRYEIGGQATDTGGRETWLFLEEEWTPEQDGPIVRLTRDRAMAPRTSCALHTGEGGAGGAGAVSTDESAGGAND